MQPNFDEYGPNNSQDPKRVWPTNSQDPNQILTEHTYNKKKEYSQVTAASLLCGFSCFCALYHNSIPMKGTLLIRSKTVTVRFIKLCRHTFHCYQQQ